MGAMSKGGGSVAGSASDRAPNEPIKPDNTPEMDHAVEDLLRRAAEHSLGAEFVARGSLDAVAATFEVHAFVVAAARNALAASRGGQP